MVLYTVGIRLIYFVCVQLGIKFAVELEIGRCAVGETEKNRRVMYTGSCLLRHKQHTVLCIVICVRVRKSLVPMLK